MSRTEMEREISDWRKLADDAMRLLDNILSQRVSYTMTEHRAAEIVAENNRALALLRTRLDEVITEHVRPEPVVFTPQKNRDLPVATP